MLVRQDFLNPSTYGFRASASDGLNSRGKKKGVLCPWADYALALSLSNLQAFRIIPAARGITEQAHTSRTQRLVPILSAASSKRPVSYSSNFTEIVFPTKCREMGVKKGVNGLVIANIGTVTCD